MKLKIIKDTYLKQYQYQISDPQTPASSFVKVLAGTELDCTSCEECIDEYGSHYRVCLSTPCETLSQGYLYVNHCTPLNSFLAADPLLIKVLKAIDAYGFKLSLEPGEINIVAIRNMNPQGEPVNPTPNKFDDLLILFTYQEGAYKLIDKWVCTTEPGKFWTQNPMNPGGAARIDIPGQYSSWQVGFHQGKMNHEALVQTGGKIRVRRDANKDFSSQGDSISEGFFGVNIHHGWDSSYENIGRTSAGCVVIPRIALQKLFMSKIKSDPRYIKDARFVFTVSFLGGKDVASR